MHLLCVLVLYACASMCECLYVSVGVSVIVYVRVYVCMLVCVYYQEVFQTCVHSKSLFVMNCLRSISDIHTL